MARQSAAALTLTGILEHQRKAVRMQNFDVLGKLDVVKIQKQTAIVTMDFGKLGPTIAKHRETGELLLVTDWMGLPDLRATSEELCPTCAVKCDECEKGKRACTYPGCGGAGEIKVSSKPCPGAGCVVKTGKFKADCKTCGGSGGVPDPIPCPGCKGTKIGTCYLCRGTGKRSSGKVNGKTCSSCDGHGRKAAKTPQQIQSFKHRDVEGMIALGPIVGLVWHSTRAGEQARFVTCRVTPDETDNLMVLLLQSQAPGSPAYLLGGRPTFDM